MGTKDSKLSGLILGAVMGLILVLGFAYVITNNNRVEQLEQEKVQQQAQTKIDFIKASLDVVYVQYGSYPATTETLLENTKEGTRENLKTAIESLDDYSYKVRGDNQAYEITYTLDGEKKTIKGEYQKELR